MSDVDRGLEGLVPLAQGRGYAELQGGYSTLAGPYARGEAGYRLLPTVGLFGFGQWTPAESTAGVGARWAF